MEDPERTIRAEIERDGIISVARFMELALYQPQYGYYRRERKPFGRSGDFYTAEQLQPVFGDVIDAYVSRVAGAQGAGESFSVVEIGAGSADLRATLAPWNYLGFDWSGDALPATVHGIILANEFFDALPVHLLASHKAGWYELGVQVSGGRFSLCHMPLTTPELLDYANCYGSGIPEGGRMEACIEAARWLERLASIHRSGSFVIIDYGYSTRELPRLSAGTIMSYRHHHASADFLSDPGQRDITSHVNFSFLRDVALRSGYRIVREVSLREWVHQVWGEEAFAAVWSSRDQRWRLQWKQLSMGMGETFRVLELSRSNPEDAPRPEEK